MNYIQEIMSQPWKRYIAACGEEGRKWLDIYHQHHLIDLASQEALTHFRKRQDKIGWASVRIAETVRERLPGDVPRSIVALLDRWFHGVRGYGYFVCGELDRASDEMEAARDAVVDAVHAARFLLPLAFHSHEFTLHRARIERNRRCWDAMWQHIGVARAMVEERIPLFRLPDGQVIDLQSIRSFLSGLDLPVGELTHSAVFFDLQRRHQLFEAFLRGLVTTTDFTIAYP